MLMVTVSPLQDPAGLMDDCPKLTNLHRNDENLDYGIENCGDDDDDDENVHNGDDDDGDDNNDNDDDYVDENLVHICSHPPL